MTNCDNFKVVCQKLMENLQLATDPYIKVDIVTKITQLADRYVPVGRAKMSLSVYFLFVILCGIEMVEAEFTHHIHARPSKWSGVENKDLH
jgi:hypothetical protein